jgi:hypothetical protein
MLFEKTLNRKVMGAKQESTEQQPDAPMDLERNGGANGNSNGAHGPSKTWQGYIQGVLWTIRSHIQVLFAKKPQTAKKEHGPASMGKILNLMR